MKQTLLSLLLLLSITGRAQGNYLDFDGTDDYGDVPNSATLLSNATALTLSCDVYPKRVTSGFPDFNGFAGYRNETDFDFYLIQLSSTDVEARFRNAGGAYTITYTGLQLNQWNHFFLTYDGTTLRLYNGAAMVGSVPASGAVPASPSGDFRIGIVTYQSFDWYHSGYLDEVSLWNKALSASDISAIMSNNGEIANPSSETNLKLYYKCNQGTPYGDNTGLTTVNDELALHNGTLVNFSLTGNTSNWGGTPLAAPQFAQNRIALYPNPVTDALQFSGTDADTGAVITDLSGRIVQRLTLSAEHHTDVSALQAGVYILKPDGYPAIRFIKS